MRSQADQGADRGEGHRALIEHFQALWQTLAWVPAINSGSGSVSGGPRRAAP
jgi:hypothetical protein